MSVFAQAHPPQGLEQIATANSTATPLSGINVRDNQAGVGYCLNPERG